MTVDVPTLMSIIGALIGVAAMLYMRSFGQQVNSIHGRLKDAHADNEKLWEQLGEVRGALQSTRENYVMRTDFNGAITRIFSKLDSIESKLDSYVTKTECRDVRHECKK